MTNKYPNADTSPERLAAIETAHRAGISDENYAAWIKMARENYNGDVAVMISDLLAMLHELRELKPWWETTGEKFDELEKLKQQLHEQRWRRLSEEEPQRMQPINLTHEGITFTSMASYVPGYDYYNLKDKTKIWWRPIPPLPKE